jgi:hypothetical protein
MAGYISITKSRPLPHFESSIDDDGKLVLADIAIQNPEIQYPGIDLCQLLSRDILVNRDGSRFETSGTKDPDPITLYFC